MCRAKWANEREGLVRVREGSESESSEYYHNSLLCWWHRVGRGRPLRAPVIHYVNWAATSPGDVGGHTARWIRHDDDDDDVNIDQCLDSANNFTTQS